MKMHHIPRWPEEKRLIWGKEEEPTLISDVEKQDNPGHTACKLPSSRVWPGPQPWLKQKPIQTNKHNQPTNQTEAEWSRTEIQSKQQIPDDSLITSACKPRALLRLKLIIINVSNSQTHTKSQPCKTEEHKWNNLCQPNYLKNFQENQFCSSDNIFFSPLKWLEYYL